MHLKPSLLLSLASLTAAATAQSGHDVQIIYTNTAGHPLNVVPGTGGLPFNVGTGTATAFNQPKTDSAGLHLAIHVVAETTTSEDEALLLDGALVLREGSPTPWNAGVDNVGFIDDDWGDVNVLGDLIYAGDTTAATTEDEQLAVFQGGVWTMLAREGDTTIAAQAPGIIGLQAVSAWGSSLSTGRITDTGELFWLATSLQNLTTGTAHDDILANPGGTAIQKSDKTQIPTGQAGGLGYALETFDINDAYVSSDGSMVMIQGDLYGPSTSDDVLIINGAVVLQEDSVIPGSTFAEPIDGSGIVKAWIDRAGNWYARGNNDGTEQDWVVRNGVVVAVSDAMQEIVPGSGEHWSDTSFSDGFFAFDGNQFGQYVIGGVTDHPDTERNGVLVVYDGLGDSYVAAREGDPVDLDGNGLFDDDCFLDLFGNDDTLLLPTGEIISVVTLRNAASTTTANALVRLLPRTASCTLRNGSGVNPVACTCLTLPVIGTNWMLDVSSGPNTIATFLFADPAPIAPFPIFGGELLIAPTAFEIGTNIPLPFSYSGLAFSVQGMRVDFDGVDISLVLTNAQDAVLGN